jgi:hypothetical protein
MTVSHRPARGDRPPEGQALLVTRRQALKAAGVLGAGLAATSLLGCSPDPPSSDGGGTTAPTSTSPATTVPASDASTVGSRSDEPGMSQPDFVALSSTLTGVSPGQLDLTAAGTILAALAPQSVALVRLKAALDAQAGAADPVIPEDDVTLARSVMSAWYTGMVDETVTTWTGTLSWTIPHATAPGVCEGFATWAEPPATHGGM